MRKLRVGILLGVSLAVAQAGATPPPNVPGAFAVQGVLRDGTGHLQSEMVTVIAALYNDPTATGAGNKLGGPYGPFHVMAVNGLFTVTIDDAALATELAGQSAGVWLDVTVGSDSYPRQQVTPEIYAILASQADSLSSACSGCVSDAMVGSISPTHLNAAVSNSLALNGKADSAFQPALTFNNCGAGSYYSSMSGATVSCSAAVSGLALSPASSSGLSLSSATGAVTITVDNTFLQHSLDSFTVNGASATSGTACPSGDAIQSITGGGAFNCISTVNNATNATTAANATTADGMSAACAAANGGHGCITHSQILSGTLQPTMTVTIPHPLGASANVPNGCGVGVLPIEVCDTCPVVNGIQTIAIGGGCGITGSTTAFIASQGTNPLFPIPTPAPSPNPESAAVQTQYCCLANPSCAGGGTPVLNVRANCVQLNAIP